MAPQSAICTPDFVSEARSRRLALDGGCGLIRRTERPGADLDGDAHAGRTDGERDLLRCDSDARSRKLRDQCSSGGAAVEVAQAAAQKHGERPLWLFRLVYVRVMVIASSGVARGCMSVHGVCVGGGGYEVPPPCRV